MASMKNLIGQTLGQYKIIGQIGQRGMATVFKAYQPGLDGDIALKVLPPYVAEKQGFTERFIREAQVIGNLHHPNILPVYDSAQSIQPQSRHPVEIAVLTIFGLVCLCGLGGTLLSLIAGADLGQMSFTSTFMGLVFASISSITMIWLRDKNKPASAWLAMGVILWFIGVSLVGTGGATVSHKPGDMANFGWSMFFCLGPGGIFTLLGLALYGYDHRQKQQAALVSASQEMRLTEKKRNWTAKLDKAAEYRKHITALIKQKKGSSLVDQLAPITGKLTRWELHLQKLADRLEDFEGNRLIQRDLREVPVAITRLQKQLNTETDPYVQKEMEETLAKYHEQQRQLDSLVSLMRRTELDIDETLADIGAIYSQLQLLGAKDVDSSRAKRLSEDINEQADRMGDLLSAMDEVHESTSSFRV